MRVPSIVKMCRWMEVSRSGFYEWRNAPESATAKRRGVLALVVKKSFYESNETYGYRRVHADLAAWGVPGGPAISSGRPHPRRAADTEWCRGVPGHPSKHGANIGDERSRPPRRYLLGRRREILGLSRAKV
jgi:hypothetical protein